MCHAFLKIKCDMIWKLVQALPLPSFIFCGIHYTLLCELCELETLDL